MCTGLTVFILPSMQSNVLLVVLGLIFLIVPVVNHIGIFIAIRRHNRQVEEALSGNSSSGYYLQAGKESSYWHDDSDPCAIALLSALQD